MLERYLWRVLFEKCSRWYRQAFPSFYFFIFHSTYFIKIHYSFGVKALLTQNLENVLKQVFLHSLPHSKQQETRTNCSRKVREIESGSLER